jgi:tagatose 1,6-diphosphate aldolase
MSIKLTPGKIAGLKAVSDGRGVIAAAALDQRGLLKKMIAKAQGGGEVADEKVVEFKKLVANGLTKHSSSILLDVEYGLPASKSIHGKGLLLAYEKSGYDVSGPEKLPSLTEGWSVQRLKEAGADCVKILLYYTQFENSSFNEQKKAWVERIGAECRGLDMALFLELLAYDPHGADESGLEYAKQKPEIVREFMQEFSKDRYGADVLKLEAPVQMAYVEGTKAYQGVRAYTRAEAMELFRSTAAMTDKPIVYLSAGVSSAAFIEMLELALESGVKFHGVLGGRANWQDGVPVFVRQGPAALEEWLNTTGAGNVQNVNRVLQSAHPWYEARSMQA